MRLQKVINNSTYLCWPSAKTLSNNICLMSCRIDITNVLCVKIGPFFKKSRAENGLKNYGTSQCGYFFWFLWVQKEP